MKESKKVHEPRGVQGKVICTNSIEKPLEGGGFDRFIAGEIYDPADYDYPLEKPNFKSHKETTPRGSRKPGTPGQGEVE